MRRTAFCGCALDDVRAHAVAFLQAMRNMEIGAASENLDRFLEHDDGRSAIDVVIAIEKDRLSGLNGGRETRHGCDPYRA